MSVEQRDLECSNCTFSYQNESKERKIIESEEEADNISAHFNRSILMGNFICNRCYGKYSLAKSHEKTLSQKSSESQTSDPSTKTSGGSVVIFEEKKKDEVEKIELSIPRTLSTHKRCFICGKKSNFIQVPKEARDQVYSRRFIYIPRGNRCCSSHLINRRFYEDELVNIKVKSPTSTIDVTEVNELLRKLKISSDRELTDRVGDHTLSEKRLFIFTGLNWEQITEIIGMFKSMRDTDNRSILQALVVFLFRLRTGNSNNLIASILGLERPQMVSSYSKAIIQAFEKDILPKYFGLKAITREQILENTAPVVKEIHNLGADKAALICDGTYLRHEKSTNNEYQRKSY